VTVVTLKLCAVLPTELPQHVQSGGVGLRDCHVLVALQVEGAGPENPDDAGTEKQDLVADRDRTDDVPAVGQAREGLSEDGCEESVNPAQPPFRLTLFEGGGCRYFVDLFLWADHVLGPPAVPVDPDGVGGAAYFAEVGLAGVTEAAPLATAAEEKLQDWDKGGGEYLLGSTVTLSPSS
jgi:hypothetical protein